MPESVTKLTLSRFLSVLRLWEFNGQCDELEKE